MKKTLENLTKAFIGESQARNRYTIYAEIAKEEGYEQISAVFLETADQEREHARWLFKMISDVKKELGGEEFDEVVVEASAPTAMGTTMENLEAAATGENYESEQMYPEFAAIADEEGLGKVAARLKAIAKAEAHHEERYRKIMKSIDSDQIFEKSNPVDWVCRKCGYLYEGERAPGKCPACDEVKAYYQVKCEEY
ncbi:rubrerythrin [Patescibacteria group bacterium]